MKTIRKTIETICVGTSLAVAMAIVGSAFPGQTAEKGSAKGGASELLSLKRITTIAEAEALQPGDALAMACAKCKSVLVQNVTKEKGHIKVMTVGEKHLCPGCESTIEVVGVGRGKHDQVKHVCKGCGDESVFCCATKPGRKATKGMENK